MARQELARVDALKAKALADPWGLWEQLADLKDHVVICNINEKLGRVIEDLHRDTAPHAIPVVVLVQDLALWDAHHEWLPSAEQGQFLALLAPASEPKSLTLARVAQARAAIILADPRQGDLADARSTLVAVAVEKQNRRVHTVIELLSSVHRAHLSNTEVDEVVCLGELSEKLIAQSCITPGVEGIFDRLLGARASKSRFYLPALPDEYAALSYRALWRRSISEHWPVLLCGFVRPAVVAEAGQQAGDHYVLNPGPGTDFGRDMPLQAGDRLIVIANHLVSAKSLRQMALGEDSSQAS